jgi:hypothetical protein
MFLEKTKSIKMKKIIFIGVLSVALLSACKKEVRFCGVKDPINDIMWLKDTVKDNPANFYIYKVKYNNTEGFEIMSNPNTNFSGSSFNSCDNKIIYYSQSGFVLVNTYPPDFESNQKFKEKIYPR